jgi:hypothetical protein
MRELKKSRLNLRLPAELLVWMKKHAQTNNTNVTRLVVDYFTKKRKVEEG